MAKMNEIRVVYDRQSNTLNIWFDDPRKEYVCEETGEEVILVKDRKGQVIGFEKLNFIPRGTNVPKKSLPVRAVVA